MSGVTSVVAQDSADDLFRDSSTVLDELYQYDQIEFRNGSDYQQGRIHATSVHIVHQTGIKDLNEKIWDVVGAESYLERLHLELHRYFKSHPDDGAIFQSNYKDHFISSNLDDVAFAERVMAPLRVSLDSWMRQHLPTIGKTWVAEHLAHTSGHNVWGAHYWLANTRPHTWGIGGQAVYTSQSVNEFQTRARSVRDRLMNEAAKFELSAAGVVRMIQHFLGRDNGGTESLRRWLNYQGATSLFEPMYSYYQLLQVGDFYPFPPTPQQVQNLSQVIAERKLSPLGLPRYTWEVERRIAFQNGKHARYVAVTDIAGLGAIARIDQDQWLANGASLEALQSVYVDTIAAMNDQASRFYAELRSELGPEAPISVYQHRGDDLVWFLPEMSAVQKDRLDRYFRDMSLHEVSFGHADHSRRFRTHYSGIVKVAQDANAAAAVLNALTVAREQLKAAELVSYIPKELIFFSQAGVMPTTVDGIPLDDLALAFAKRGFDPKFEPPRVVQWPDGHIQAYDHRRVVAAVLAGLDHVPVQIIDSSSPFPEQMGLSGKLIVDMQVPGTSILEAAGAIPKTWGDAVLFRSANQAMYGSPAFPLYGTRRVPHVRSELLVDYQRFVCEYLLNPEKAKETKFFSQWLKETAQVESKPPR